MSEKLLSCDHCGNTDPRLLTNTIGSSYWIRCTKCGLQTDHLGRSSEAIAAWNRRAKPVIDDATVERMCAVVSGGVFGILPPDVQAEYRNRMRAALAVLNDGKGE